MGARILTLGARSGPAGVVGAPLVGVWILWASWDASEDPARWGSLGLLAVLLVWVAIVLAPAHVPLRRSRLVMLALAGAFVVWNFVSMLWAQFPADAWAGSALAMLYVVSFVPFTLWRLSDNAVRALIGLWALGISVTGGVVLARIGLDAEAPGLFQDGRLAAPIGYANASAALWTMAAIPTLQVAASRDLPIWLRGVATGSATLLLELSVLGQSRGWLFLLPVSIAVWALCARGRLRAMLGATAAAVPAAAALPSLLGVFDRYESGGDFGSAAQRAALVAAACALGGALLGAGWAALDRRTALDERLLRRIGISLAALTLLGLAGGGVVAAREAASADGWLRTRWEDFTQGYSGGAEGSRFTGSLGTDRYQLWTAALREFRRHPVEGLGSNNFAAPYLLERTDNLHEPTSPHSTPLRLLSELGVVGTAAFGGLVGLAALHALRRRRQARPGAGACAGAAVAVAGYWLIHGSIDVFWEVPALAAPALGMLAIAGSRVFSSSPDRRLAQAQLTPRRAARVATVAASSLLAVGACVALVPPWLSASYQKAGVRVWQQDGPLAYERLDRAASLNRLTSDPLMVKGAIALRLGDPAVAAAAFRAALAREPDLWYAHLELGLTQAALGERADALASVARAQALNPRDPLVEIVRQLLARGEAVEAVFINDLYARRVQRFSFPYINDTYFAPYDLQDPSDR